MPTPNYRAVFFKHNQSTLGRYQCVYCGKWLSKKNITIDHLIPQHLFKNTKKIMYFISVLMLTLNSTIIYAPLLFGSTFLLTKYEHSMINLVGACSHCNQSKSSNLDYRIIKGSIMRFKIISIPTYAVAKIVKIIYSPFKFMRRIFKPKCKRRIRKK